MNKSTRKKTAARKGASKDPDTTVNTQPAPKAKPPNDDYEQIERAVYDGMQDLRTTPKRK